MKKILLGNEAIALGAIRAGVNIVTGYPGTPSTEVVETIVKHNPGDIYVEWSVNEKVALEVAAGASYAGARSLVTMKQVGLNVASDPLMSLTYIGVKGGLVIFAADDPGPFSSQTEQDTRHFARFANLPVLDPSTPEEAYEMIQYAFELSETIGLPVLFRPTTRVCHSSSTVEINEERHIHKIEGFKKSSDWVIFPSLVNRKHLQLEKTQEQLSSMFSGLSFNRLTGKGTKGIVASGVAYTYVSEFLSRFHEIEVKLFKVGTPYPFPKEKAIEFLNGLEEVLVVEELDPVVEEALIESSIAFPTRINIYGKKTGHLPCVGEYSYEIVQAGIARFLLIEDLTVESAFVTLPLPMRPPILCPGCPHEASFLAVKTAVHDRKVIFCGDIGCYTLGNVEPINMVDTCLCMGAGITLAQGLQRVEPDTKVVAFIGDGTLFHSGIPAILNAVYNNSDIIIIVLDNLTTAMTGLQPNPGTGETIMNEFSPKIDIQELISACGVTQVAKVDPLAHHEAVEAISCAMQSKGPSVVIFESPCVKLPDFEAMGMKQKVNSHCISCEKCLSIGCSAISRIGEKPTIDTSLCVGCTLCEQACPVGAIGGVTD